MSKNELRKILEENNIEDTMEILLKMINGKTIDYEDVGLEMDIFEKFVKRHTYSENTVKSYRGKYQMFLKWSKERGITKSFRNNN